MKILESVILFFNILFWVIGIIVLFSVAYQYGLAALICFLLFLIFYFKANYFIISKLDKFVYSDWAVFRNKLVWANGQAITILIIISLIARTVMDKS